MKTSESDAGIVYKICARAEWEAARVVGAYHGSDHDKRDGFIHLSAYYQLAATAAKYFRNRSNLVLIAFDSASLAAGLKWEPSSTGDLFPHFYGTLPLTAALWVHPLPLGADGIPQLPDKPEEPSP